MAGLISRFGDLISSSDETTTPTSRSSSSPDETTTQSSRSSSSPDDGSERTDRAQLLLITGLALAVILVALVLLLNTVIYTENLATRGVDTGGTEAAELRSGTAADLETLFARTDWSTHDPDAFEADLAAYAAATREHRLRDGTVTRIGTETTDGSHVTQENIREFDPSNDHLENTTAESGDEWTLVEDATRTRSYVLADVSVTESIANESVINEEAFRVTVASADEEWTLYVYELDDGPVVRVNGATRELDDGGRIDLTAGTVDGDPWDALVWASGVEDPSAERSSRTDYEITYANGDTVEGTYEFVVDTQTGVSTASPNEPLHDEPHESPYAVDAVYSVDATIGLQRPELRYEDRVRVAPGERDD